MRYNTGNPVEPNGSSDPRDLADNAANLDLALNSPSLTWTDRLGKSRRSWAGSTGYEDLGDYAAGLAFTSYNQVFRYSGQFYRAKASTALPFTTTGTIGTDLPLFIGVGDAVLRGDLANAADGAGLVAYDQNLEYPAGTVGGDLLPKVNGETRIRGSSSGGTPHMLVTRSISGPTRIHQEPNGFVDEGTTAKYDWMFTPYDIDQANYRIFNVFLSHGDSVLNSGLNGENGRAYLGAKALGDEFGVWPSLHFGFGDAQSAVSVPMKAYYFDHSDTAWRTPMKGAWRAGRAVTAGDYMLANFKLYQAGSSGVCGSTKPGHTSGTVSDGNINWTFVRDFQATAASIAATVLIGNRDDMPKFGLFSYRLQIAKPVAVWNDVRLTFLGSSNEAAVSLRSNVGTDDLLLNSEKVAASLRFDATAGFIQNNGWEWLMAPKSFSAGETTIPLTNTELVSFNNSVATNVTSFTGRAYQRFFVEAVNGNTTLKQGTNIKLAGGVDKVLSANEVLCFVMNSTGTIARQV